MDTDYVILSNRRINNRVWSEFTLAVMKKYGTTYGHITTEIEIALKNRTMQILSELKNGGANGTTKVEQSRETNHI